MFRLDHTLNRRRCLADMLTGLGSLACASLLTQSARAQQPYAIDVNPQSPHAARSSPEPAAAQQVLMVFCSGALSHLDTFDWKPELIKQDGKPMPNPEASVTFQGENGNIAQPRYPFQPRGESAKMTSDLLPEIGELADDFCFLHSLTTKSNTHGPGENCMSTGFTLDGFPSIGAWTTYALGTENQDLPAFVAIPDPRGVPQASLNNWGAGFLPSVFQGTALNARRPVPHLHPPAPVTPQTEQAARQLLQDLNAVHLQQFPGDSELLARIASYELAARMQLSVPQVMDLGQEDQRTWKAYGADDPKHPVRAEFAKNCILARRLLEQGVRFVQLFNGAYAMGEGVGNWDGHRKLKEQYDQHGWILDRPVAALLRDLKQRGLLQRTLVIFCTEFGRMPMFQKGASGRDHNPLGFTAMLMGAGVKSPYSYGATDELGYQAAEQIVSIHDFHATVMHLLGIDHRRLTFYNNGIQRRLTDVHGEVIHDVLS